MTYKSVSTINILTPSIQHKTPKPPNIGHIWTKQTISTHFQAFRKLN